MTRNSATGVGFIAILLWALLAYFTAESGQVPPFQLTAMSFGIGGLAGALTWIVRPQGIAALRQPAKVWALGIVGLFGYHFLYFTALRNAPTVDASLICYLWPLLIVLMSALGPGERLGLHHVAGALMGFAGAVMIVTRGQGIALNPDYAFGYGIAFLAAFFWSSYSVLSRRFREVPTDVVTGFCLVTAILATIAHLMLEETIWPQGMGEWLAVVGLGIGPVGLAFFVWDIGVKHGDIQVLGAASYSAPLLSTLLLVALGASPFTWVIAIACLLITLGATVAAKDMILRRKVQ
ncbi:DMT family transporter [Nioella ostreopsis]|uniref:aromatic amino acid exporter YddG n=1 Tax=Nioella ostreopsis TaxID=2448479 RepID=UPI000FD710D8|nr:EamA family transporter [Nioella ostreopsis]